MAEVVVIGSLNEDVVVEVARSPLPGETVLGRTVRRGAGGKGANQAVAAARAGAAVRMAGAVGNDPAGERLCKALADEGIRTAGVATAPEPTGTAIVIVEDGGENSIVVVPGANSACTAAGLDPLDPADVVVAQGEIPPETIRAAADTARRSGARFVLNLAPVVEVDLSTSPIDVLIVNEHEAGRLYGVPSAGVVTMALELGRRANCAVVITLGADGAVVARDGTATTVPSYPPSLLVDTTGAGDAFVGALAAALVAGCDLLEATRWGAAAGSIAVSAVGAQSARATRADIQKVMSRHP